MNFFDILNLVLGLSLFLFGMNLMSESLKNTVGGGLKRLLEKMTSNKWRGFLLGALVTAIIQSSSAVTVMVVGFVNSGTMTLTQTVGVMMGANVGTSITSWITALSGLEGGATLGSVMQWFKPSTFVPVLAFTGILLYSIGKTRRRKGIGVILLGFSVLMLGMDVMSDAVSGLEENETFRSILLVFENPILGLVAGMVMTAIVQSSSASVGILQSLTATGAITFGNAIPIIMGQNIGTCITALISSVGANKNAKRASMIHLLFNVIGSAIGLSALFVLKYLLNLSFLSGRIDMWGIAIVHTVFNLLTFAFLFPVSKLLERLAILLVGKSKKNKEICFIDERLLNTPAAAAIRAGVLTCEMGELAVGAVEESLQMLNFGYDQQLALSIDKRERSVDEYEDKLGSFLVKISAESITAAESRELGSLLHILGDIERICDHARNLSQSAEEIKEKAIALPEETKKEISVLSDAVKEISQLSVRSIKENSDNFERVESLEVIIDRLCFEIKSRHINRMREEKSAAEIGFVVNDILNDLERIGDHSTNITECISSVKRGGALELHKRQREYFESPNTTDDIREEYAKKYCI